MPPECLPGIFVAERCEECACIGMGAPRKQHGTIHDRRMAIARQMVNDAQIVTPGGVARIENADLRFAQQDELQGVGG